MSLLPSHTRAPLSRSRTPNASGRAHRRWFFSRGLARALPLAASVGALLSTASAHASTRSGQDGIQRNGRVVVATTDSPSAASGAAVLVRGGPPWTAKGIGDTQGGRFLRRFGNVVYVVNTTAGTISRVRDGGAPLPLLDVGHGSLPQDIHVRDATTAYVTRRDRSRLLRFDLRTGTSEPVADLSMLVGAKERLEVRTLHADGERLLIQLDLFDQSGTSRGALAVLDMRTERFIDADPVAVGLQPIVLRGAPPQLKMQQRGRTLFVSTTLGRFDSRGGIETVDLDALVATGFVLDEPQVGGADLGAFVMTDVDEGFCVIHTDIVPSTHLRHFTRVGGVTPGPDLITLLGDAVDTLAYDARRQRLYIPSGFSGFGGPEGLRVLDTRTHLESEPVATGMRAHDVVLARAGGDGLVHDGENEPSHPAPRSGAPKPASKDDANLDRRGPAVPTKNPARTRKRAFHAPSATLLDGLR